MMQQSLGTALLLSWIANGTSLVFPKANVASRVQPLQSKLQEEYIPPLDAEPPLKVLLMVEPTPFNYVSGYANRFKEMLKFLHKAGDKVEVLTPDKDPNPPKEFMGFPITTNRGYEFPLYNQVTLTFDFKLATRKIIERFKPDLIHVSTPSAIIYPAILWARLFNIPLVMSYHTNFAAYAKEYGKFYGANTLADIFVRTFHNQADLTLCTSPQLKKELESLGVRRVDLWRWGVDVEVFNPLYRDEVMRNKLSYGNPDAPLLIYVGRLGVEKKLMRLKKVLDENPGARLALVGKGPHEAELKRFFEGYPVHFAGQITGEPLSQAFASADIFVMPSDSETLGFVAIEAMASGIPVVAVAAGGLIDLIEHGQNGYLAKNDDNVDEFSAHVRELIANVQKRSEIGVYARKWAEGWSWEAATSKLRNIQYRTAIRIHKSRDLESRNFFEDIEEALLTRGNQYRPDLS